MIEATAGQVAQRAGCSTATVSRVLNGSGPVSRETHEAVLKAIQEMGAVNLRRRRSSQRSTFGAPGPGKQSGLVEVVMHLTSPIEHLEVTAGEIELGPIKHCPPDRFFRPENRYCNTHFRRIIDGAMDELTRCRLRPVLRTTNDLQDSQLLADINDSDMQGLILLGNDGPAVDPFLQAARCPFVSFVGAGRQGMPYVASDDLPGMRQAVAHLMKLGHSAIAYVACPQNVPGFAERFIAFKMAMQEAALPVRDNWVFSKSVHVADIQTGMIEILAGPSRPTAVVCSYDSAALGVIRAAAKHGLRVPKDLSVIGFGDQDIAELMQPALTTVHVPGYEMGQMAVCLLFMQRMNAELAGKASVRLPTHLVERASTAPAKATNQTM